MEKIIDICPLESDLMVTETNYSCSENDCTSSFNKISNLQLHLVKHHKVGSLVPKSKGVVFRFFCPKKDCVYNIDRANNKSFSQKRLLKQHYMKMHASKDYVCNKCGLQNSLASAHARHSKSCGMKFSCGACGWEYNSNESLLVHLMRKHPQIHQAYLKNKAECKKKSSEVSKKKFDKVTDIKKNKIPNNCQLNEKSYDFTKTDLPKIPIDNKNKCFNVRNVIQFDHNYTKSFNVEENNENNNVIFVSIFNQSNDTNEKYQLAFPTECNPTHAIVPINLLNNGEFLKNLNSETKTDNISKMNRNITPKNNSETLTSTTKSTHANQCTQTPLKLSKKSMFSATNKSNVETQTLNQLWNHLSVDKNKIKQKNTSMQSSANKKSQTNHSKLSLKIIKNQKKNKVDKNVNTCSISRRVKNCKQNGNKKISPKTNHCNVSSNTFTNTDDLSENISSDDNDRFKTCNEDTLEDNSVIDEHSNVFLSNSVLKPISNSSSMDFNCQFDCEDIATQSSNIETQTALDELLYSNPPKCGDMQDDIFSELIRLSDTQTQTTWPLNCELKENTKVEADPKDIVTNFSDIKTQTAFDKLLYSNTSKCDDMQDDIFSELIHLSDIQTQTTWPLNCEDNSKVEIDSKDTGTQFSDIETQTALDELLYSNTPKCDDMQDDIFSKLIHLSDIQTQTTWPLNRDWKEISEVEINSKDSTILKSTETQTIDTKSYKNPLFLTCNYNMDKNSPLFESTSHFCFKETQTSSCYLDSSKRKSLNSKNIARLELLDNSLNSNCNSNDFSTKSILPSAETQTQFSFDDNQFLNRKSDVLLSYCTTETQTCFEDDYLEDV